MIRIAGRIASALETTRSMRRDRSGRLGRGRRRRSTSDRRCRWTRRDRRPRRESELAAAERADQCQERPRSRDDMVSTSTQFVKPESFIIRQGSLATRTRVVVEAEFTTVGSARPSDPSVSPGMPVLRSSRGRQSASQGSLFRPVRRVGLRCNERSLERTIRAFPADRSAAGTHGRARLSPRSQRRC